MLEPSTKFDCEIEMNRPPFQVMLSWEWHWITTEMISWIYANHPSWTKLQIKYPGRETPFLKLDNSPETVRLSEKILVRTDFNSCVPDNYSVTCIVYFKNDLDRSEAYEISKEDLLNTFVVRLHNMFGKDWDYFDTFYSDSEKPAFGSYVNSEKLRKIPRITPASLKSRREAASRKFWRAKKELSLETVYVLSFKGAPFIKIGHTYQDFERRIYGYIFPGTDKARSIAQYDIDFENSLILNTTAGRTDKSLINSSKGKTIENLLLGEFKGYKLSSVGAWKAPREFLDAKCLPIVKEFIVSGKLPNIKCVQRLSDYTGFSSGSEMRDYNLKMGVSNKAVRFWKRQQEPAKVYNRHCKTKEGDKL